MKNTVLLITLGIIAALFEGCRREDFREHIFEIPGMTKANTNIIKKAVSVYKDSGVDMNSLEFDLAKKTLRVRFNSMSIAQTNIRMAIDSKGITVKYPVKNGEPAGYINTRDKEVK